MHSRIFAVIPALFAFSAAVTFAQAAPKEAHADLVNSQGVKIGSAKFNPSALGLRVTVRVEHLTPGEHGIHIHNVGKCEGPAFTTAGPHFNPTDAHHGVHNAQDPHPHLRNRRPAPRAWSRACVRSIAGTPEFLPRCPEL